MYNPLLNWKSPDPLLWKTAKSSEVYNIVRDDLYLYQFTSTLDGLRTWPSFIQHAIIDVAILEPCPVKWSALAVQLLVMLVILVDSLKGHSVGAR